MKPVFGSDPEFFVAKGNKIISASDVLPDKFQKLELDDNIEVFYDGIQAEFNVPPSDSIDEMVNIMGKTIKLITKYLSSKKCEMVILPAVGMDKDILENAPEEASMFGCDVDFDAYSGRPNPTHRNMTKHLYRYAGGHIHLGFSHIPELYETIYYDLNVVDFIKVLDLIVGIPCVLLDRSTKNKVRRQMYGKAGCFRTTEYGVEYRTLSNFWIKSPVFTDIVHRLSRIALRIVVANMHRTLLSKRLPVKKAINNNDMSAAMFIYNTLKEEFFKPASMEGDPFYSGDERLDIAFEYLVQNRTYERMHYTKAWEGPQSLRELYHSWLETDEKFSEVLEKS